MSAASHLARRAAQKERVRILYRRALKDTLNWAVHRHLFYQDASELRERFEANKNVENLEAIDRLIADGEASHNKWRHPDPYIVPWAPGGSKFTRNPTPPAGSKSQFRIQIWIHTKIKARNTTSCSCRSYCCKTTSTFTICREGEDHLRDPNFQLDAFRFCNFPSFLPGRGEQSYPIVSATGSQRTLGPTGISFGPEFYRGPVLSSSPAIPFPPAGPFQYSGFPFETNFPLPSNSYSGVSTGYVDSSSVGPVFFPAIPSQLVGPSGVVSSHYPRPYVMNLPGGTSIVGPESRKWGGQALDLNTGPGNTDVERRDERLSSALRQLPVPGSQASADEQIKPYQMASGVFEEKGA
ncbi:NADH dehydrogenase [ubiquinone] 1 beta subcomplex subunit 9 [Camellia lanceoleosa]|uniref:NADH dehydrogenase [ubiquinone] 1 beta subcomplex subunit 9 n=1 Tax=Camellia lanceoleosa TaxID=1840588 RepID=A0ACC0IAF9_9ERIC|nr:NADH dehydrogenase [ubiquinone] 1 beta subcomplex subunit 9 [Camellia lanceoleosa]